MSRKPRLQANHLHYHVTVYCYSSENLLTSDEDFISYLRTLRLVKGKHRFKLFNFEILPDRVQLLLKPSQKIPLSRTMQLLNWLYARDYNRRKNLKGRFWVERYESVPFSVKESDLARMREINLSPVNAGLVEQAGNWKWSAYPTLADGVVNELVDFHPDYLALGENTEVRQEMYRRIVEETNGDWQDKVAV
jgi:putative transposase